MIKLQTYKVLSSLLLYPTNEIKNSIDMVLDILMKDKILSSININKMEFFINYIKKNELLYLQEEYVSIFDRQKAFSLYLFEHIHGDSRERGMAMIDLKNLYRNSKFDVSSNEELPDFIPVFLEYLSLLSKEQSSLLLGEIVNIIAILHLRLKAINSAYYVIFSILESLSCIKSDEKIIRKFINNDDFLKVSNLDIDKNWEEPKIF